MTKEESWEYYTQTRSDNTPEFDELYYEGWNACKKEIAKFIKEDPYWVMKIGIKLEGM